MVWWELSTSPWLLFSLFTQFEDLAQFPAHLRPGLENGFLSHFAAGGKWVSMRKWWCQRTFMNIKKMSERGLEPLSLFLILRHALWSTCEFRARFEISGSYELGATLWGTEQYHKWAPLKPDHCRWPLSMPCDTDFWGCSVGWEWFTSTMPSGFQLWSWKLGRV